MLCAIKNLHNEKQIIEADFGLVVNCSGCLLLLNEKPYLFWLSLDLLPMPAAENIPVSTGLLCCVLLFR